MTNKSTNDINNTNNTPEYDWYEDENPPPGTSLTLWTLQNDSKVPHHLWLGIENYVERGINPGSALSAIFCGDLYRAFGNADYEVRTSMWHIVKYIYTYLPRDCWGSHERYNLWKGKPKQPNPT